jgi:hypothetical protein
MPTDLTAYAREGQKPETTNPYMRSSDSWMAFEAGRQIVGMSDVKRAWKSRGHSVKIDTKGGSTVTVTFGGKKTFGILTVDRC